MKIVIVEDNVLNMMLLSEVSSDYGEVIQINDVTDIIDRICKAKPDLILMDIQLPGDHTGDYYITKLREIPEFENTQVRW